MTTNCFFFNAKKCFIVFLLLFSSPAVFAGTPLEGKWLSGDNSGLVFTGSQYQVIDNGQVVDRGVFTLQENVLIAQSQVSNETIYYLYQCQNGVLMMQDEFGQAYQFQLSSKTGSMPNVPPQQKQSSPNQSVGQQTPAQVVQFLAGRWKDIRSSGHTIIEIQANGTFSYYSDSTASGDFSNQYGNTGSWGYGSQNSLNGRWTAKGSAQQGTIYYQAQNGEQGTLDYQVMNENGQIFWNECYFDGTLYQRQ